MQTSVWTSVILQQARSRGQVNLRRRSLFVSTENGSGRSRCRCGRTMTDISSPIWSSKSSSPRGRQTALPDTPSSERGRGARHIRLSAGSHPPPPAAPHARRPQLHKLEPLQRPHRSPSNETRPSRLAGRLRRARGVGDPWKKAPVHNRPAICPSDDTSPAVRTTLSLRPPPPRNLAATCQRARPNRRRYGSNANFHRTVSGRLQCLRPSAITALRWVCLWKC